MITHKTLYKKDDRGSIRIWYIEQEDNKYRFVSGKKGGKLITTEWTIASGKNTGRKNATSDIEQADQEIKSEYDYQLKHFYFENEKDIDKENYIKPVLAKKYKDYKDSVNFATGDWIIQSKLNGVCCIATPDGLYSRKGEKYLNAEHIENALKPLFEQHPDIILHGELYNFDLRKELNQTISLVRKTVNITEKDREDSEKYVQYHIYDGYEIGKESEKYVDRQALIDLYIDELNSKYIKKVDSIRVKSYEEMIDYFKIAIGNGEEGIILRKADMPYEHKRSNYLLKVKPEDDEEMEIVDIKEGTGNWSGVAKIITCKMDDGKIFDATFKGSLEEAKECLENKDKWINKKVTINYNGKTAYGVPQYAQFNYKNCLRAD